MDFRTSCPPVPDDTLLDRALVSAFLENVPDCVYFKDLDSRFLATSTSLARNFGCASPTDLIGKTDFDFFDEAHARPAFEDEQRIIRTGESIIGKIEKETWPDGRVTWVSTSKVALRDESGEIIGTLGLSKDITDSRSMEGALATAHQELVGASRLAGMGEVATGVLHNVGNVLNSLNVSATVLANGLRHSKADSLARLSALLQEHAGDLVAFLTTDPKGSRVPTLLSALARNAAEERDRLLAELCELQQNVDHIKEIVAMQQAYATMVGVVEPLDPAALLDDAAHMNAAALVRHHVRVERQYQFAPPVLGEKAKALQILVNLIANAKYASDEGAATDKVVTLRIEPTPPGRVRLIVADNGVGIAPENLTKIFQHGFTTRRNGHGFGLHSSANAATEMKGSLTAHSDGPGRGAAFTLELPAAAPAIPADL